MSSIAELRKYRDGSISSSAEGLRLAKSSQILTTNGRSAVRAESGFKITENQDFHNQK